MEKEILKEFQRVYEMIGDNEIEIEKLKKKVRCDMCGKRFVSFESERPFILCDRCKNKFKKRKKVNL